MKLTENSFLLLAESKEKFPISEISHFSEYPFSETESQHFLFQETQARRRNKIVGIVRIDKKIISFYAASAAESSFTIVVESNGSFGGNRGCDGGGGCFHCGEEDILQKVPMSRNEEVVRERERVAEMGDRRRMKK